MLTIDFTAQDVGRVRLVESYGPLAETALALGALRGAAPAHLRQWRTATWQRMPPAQRAMAVYLRPYAPVGVDLFTLTGPAPSFRAGAAALLDGSLEHLALEVGAFRRRPECDPVAFAGAPDGDPAALQLLTALLRALHDDAVAPLWRRARTRLAGAHAELGRRLTDDGVEGLFDAVGFGAAWTGASLVLPTAAPWTAEPLSAALHGRGLTVVPSYFATTPEPYFPIDVTRPAVLFVPVGADAEEPSAGGGEELLGRTRAAVLRAIAARPRTTGELAAALALSPSSASQHATTLREAGLVTTSRAGGRALHACTPLGRALAASLASGTAG